MVGGMIIGLILAIVFLGGGIFLGMLLSVAMEERHSKCERPYKYKPVNYSNYYRNYYREHFSKQEEETQEDNSEHEDDRDF